MKRFQKILIVTLSLLLTFPIVTVKAADYNVAANDSLYKISQLFNTSIDTLKSSNNFTMNSLTPGDVIFVPAHVYTVKNGDTMYLVAKKYGIPVTELKIANIKTGNSIVPGEKLVIPGVKPYRSTDPVISYSNGEVDLLARLIEAEAGGETFQAKIGVGAVVVNRVQSGDWAPTLKQVIYQKSGGYYQFTPVKNGMINNAPSAESKRAAWIAMFGSDPSNGATFYFDQTSKNSWLWAKPETARIDHFIYAI